MDTLTRTDRRALMQRVRRRDTTPELAVQNALHARRFGYVLHDTRLPGSPDLTLPRRRIAIFVHGCFWHGHDCPKARLPTTNRRFWVAKRMSNKARDLRKARELRARGWRVSFVWECQTKPQSVLDRKVSRLISVARKPRSSRPQLKAE